MKWLQFILSHSIFISICAAALCFQTHILLNVNPQPLVYLLVFSSTLAGYNFYWIISKYYFSRDLNHLFRKSFSNILILFFAAAAVLFCLLKLQYLIKVFCFSAVLTIIYSFPLWPVKPRFKFLKDFGFLKTILLSFTWTFATVVIPTTGFNHNFQAILILCIARFSFMLMLCAIFDSRDSRIDKLNNLRSLATDISERKLKILMILTFLVFIFSGILLRIYYSTTPQLFAFLLTGIVTLIVYQLSHKKRSYLFYYFLVDGLMLLTSILTYSASILEESFNY